MLKSIRCLKMLPSKVIIDYDAIKAEAKIGNSDLHLLLSIAKNSLREQHPTFGFCMQASKMARTLYGSKRKQTLANEDSGYLTILKGLVAWGMEEARDKNLEAFLTNIQHGAKKYK